MNRPLQVGGHHRFQVLHHAQPPLPFRHQRMATIVVEVACEAENGEVHFGRLGQFLFAQRLAAHGLLIAGSKRGVNTRIERLGEAEGQPESAPGRTHRGGPASRRSGLNRVKTFAEDWDRPEAAIYDEDPARCQIGRAHV